MDRDKQIGMYGGDKWAERELEGKWRDEGEDHEFGASDKNGEMNSNKKKKESSIWAGCEESCCYCCRSQEGW